MNRREVPILFDKKADCCGCGACLNVCPSQAISMKEDEYGFLYPWIDETVCVTCGMCKKVCAFQNHSVRNRPIATFAAVARDHTLAAGSASGGVFAALAHGFLAGDGVVFGAAFQENWSVRHCSVDRAENVCKLQGSKYTQSDTGRTYAEVKELLAAGKNVLYSGTPCQIAGLYGYLGREYDNLLTVDLVCHGVPNNRMLQEYIQSIESKYEGKVTSFTFRDKSIGWGINGSAQIEGKKRKVKLWKSASSYLYYFSDGSIYRESCYQCKYACAARPADLTIGDYWGIEKAHPEYLKKDGWDERNGISVVVVNTEKGTQYLKLLSSCVALKESAFEKASAGNAQLNHPSDPGKRSEVLHDYLHGGWSALENRFEKRIGLRKYSSQIKSMIPRFIKQKLKQISQ